MKETVCKQIVPEYVPANEFHPSEVNRVLRAVYSSTTPMAN